MQIKKRSKRAHDFRQRQVSIVTLIQIATKDLNLLDAFIIVDASV